MSFFGNIFGGGPSVDFKELVSKGAILLDVRSPEEFAAGHIDNAINIPLQAIGTEMAKIKAMGKPVIIHCLSGGRAGSALGMLQSEGIEAYNGGGFQALGAAIA